MAVHFPESDDSYDQGLRSWASVGKPICWGSSIIATGIAFPAMFKKKRTYSQISAMTTNGATNAGVAEVQEEPSSVEELPRELRASQEERGRIATLFTLIAGDIFSNIGTVISLGQQIEYQDRVHPFVFIRSMPPNAIQRIFTSSWLYRRATTPSILGGIARGMQREQHTLERLLPVFARQMNKDPTVIREKIQTANWEGLLDYLFDIEAYREEQLRQLTQGAGR